MVRKMFSVASNLTASVVRSSRGKCCSDAITKQLAMIVKRIVYSNGGHSMINFISFRSGWSSGKRNNDVGPAAGVIVGTTSTLLFLSEVVVVWVGTLEPTADAVVSWPDSLNRLSEWIQVIRHQGNFKLSNFLIEFLKFLIEFARIETICL